MSDLRSRGGIPYGYSIINGNAVVNEKEAELIRNFFDLFISGMSMSAAAKAAGLTCSRCTLPHLFYRKEYAGTDFYPAIISADYQQSLIEEREKRKNTAAGKATAKKVRRLKAPTLFRIGKPNGDVPQDPAKHIELLYDLIEPIA